MDQKTRTWILLALVVATAILPYLQVLHFGFVYDDHLAIEENPHLKLWPGVGRIFFSDIWSLSSLGKQSNYYRPMFLLAYEGLFQLSGRPWVFHLANLICHALTSVLVFFLTRRVWQSSSIAFVAAVLFAIHPAHVEPVAWIAALSEIGYTFCVLLGIYFYIREPASRWSAAAAFAAYGMALLWKESAVAFVPLIFLFDILILKTLRWKRWMAAGGVTLAYLIVRYVALNGLAPAVLYPDLAISTQVLTALSNVGFYLTKLIVPTRLRAFYPIEFVGSVNLRVALVLAMVALGVWKLRGRQAWAALWIVAGLFPVLLVSRVAVPLADRDLYLPSVGFVWLVAAALASINRNTLVAGAALLGVVYGVATVQRLPAWSDDVALFQTELQLDPGSASVRILLSSELARRGQYDDAIRYLDEVLAQHPENLEALTNKAGIFVSTRNWSGLRTTCERVFALDPNAARCLYDIGYLDEVEGRLDAAHAKFARAFQLNPELAQALLHQGLMEARMGKLDTAVGTLELAVQRIPTAPALNNLGSVYAERGEMGKAIETFKNAVRVDPSFELARRNLERAIADSR